LDISYSKITICNKNQTTNQLKQKFSHCKKMKQIMKSTNKKVMSEFEKVLSACKEPSIE